MARNFMFHRLIDKSTNEALLEPDWKSVLHLCDMIRNGNIDSKTAIKAVLRKLQFDGSQYYALEVFQIMMKCCGPLLLNELKQNWFFLTVRDILRSASETWRDEILETIVSWHRGSSGLRDLIRRLQEIGYILPPNGNSESSVGLSPPLSKNNKCKFCNASFNITKLRHHCRKCGDAICRDCLKENQLVTEYYGKARVKVCLECSSELFRREIVKLREVQRTEEATSSTTAVSTYCRAINSIKQPPPVPARRLGSFRRDLPISRQVQRSSSLPPTKNLPRITPRNTNEVNPLELSEQQQLDYVIRISEVEARGKVSIALQEEQDLELALCLSRLEMGSNSDNESKCVICLENERQFIFVDCGHLCLCHKCVRSYKKWEAEAKDGSDNKCPICRAPIVTKEPVKVFM